MSLRINKDSIYKMPPKLPYFDKSEDDSMDGDFTLFARIKIMDQEVLEGIDKFVISRNGAHSGISIVKDDYNYNIYVQYAYWFWEKTSKKDALDVQQLHFKIEEEMLDDYVNLWMVNNGEESKIDCYCNGELVGTMNYEGKLKVLYGDSPYWFGCGTMLSEADKQIGDFEFDIAFSIRKALSNEEINDLLQNYRIKYSTPVFEKYGAFKSDWELAPYFTFFCDFKDTNRFKVWNYAFNGYYPELFIKD
jgi:hypothetical protein